MRTEARAREGANRTLHMKVSGVIPAYNCRAYIAQAVQSALDQTYPLDEILVVDDGSTDGTREIVERFPSPVRCVHQSNRGVAAARNHAVQLAANRWVAFLDADDWWLPEKIARQVEAVERSSAAVLAYTGAWWIEADGSRQPAPMTSAGALWPQLRYRNPITTSSVLVRRDAVLELGGFRGKATPCEDWDLWMRLRLRHPFTSVNEPLTAYRMTAGSLSSDVDRMLRGVESMIEDNLLAGLEGWRRLMWRRRIRSAQLHCAAVTAREAASLRERTLLLQSIRQWPLPGFLPARWLDLAQNVLGQELYQSISRRLKPCLGSGACRDALGR